MLACPLAVATAQVAAAQTAIAYDSPAQPLASALSALAQRSGFKLAYSVSLSQGRTAPALQGSYTPAQALSRLLAGSGLTYRFTGASTVTIESPAAGGAVGAAGTISLDTIDVQGGGVYPSDPYVGMDNPPTTIGSKEALTQRQIPQSVSVVTQKQIQSQNLTTVDDAMRAVPGVTIETNQPGFTSYYSRGFQINTMQFDGVATGGTTSGISGPTDNLAMYDRVEVLSGPAGILNGFGGDGGVLNLVRKRAPSQFQASADFTGGSLSTARSQFDIGGPLNESGTVRGRIVGAGGLSALHARRNMAT